MCQQPKTLNRPNNPIRKIENHADKSKTSPTSSSTNENDRRTEMEQREETTPTRTLQNHGELEKTQAQGKYTLTFNRENAKEDQQFLHADPRKPASTIYRLRTCHLLARKELKVETTASS